MDANTPRTSIKRLQEAETARHSANQWRVEGNVDEARRAAERVQQATEDARREARAWLLRVAGSAHRSIDLLDTDDNAAAINASLNEACRMAEDAARARAAVRVASDCAYLAERAWSDAHQATEEAKQAG